MVEYLKSTAVSLTRRQKCQEPLCGCGVKNARQMLTPIYPGFCTSVIVVVGSFVKLMREITRGVRCRVGSVPAAERGAFSEYTMKSAW